NLTGFFGNLTGGTCPCAYTWNFGDGLWSTFPAPAHRFAASGTYSVNLWVNDSAGASSHAMTTIQVSSAPGSGASVTGSSAVPLWFWGGVGAVVIGVVVGSLLLMRARRGA
ncbi:MAG TPA: PKD domain-containing protein, partial [Thermoplasmata archaeon]|nr:PKD domain-containing protein [Thermoplasmata archaeon]